MEDIELQVKKLLEENWQVEKDSIIFHRNMRRIEGSYKQTNIIICDSTDINNWTVEGTADCAALVTVRTRISSLGTTNEEVEKAKELKYKLREEVYRIFKAVDSGEIDKPDGWEWGYPTRRQNGDNFDAPTPMLGEDINITIAYQRN